VRGFPLEQLPWWLDDELWTVELAPPVIEEPRCLRARRGRLLRRVETWTSAAAEELVAACEARLRAAAAAARGTEAQLLGDFADDVLLYARDADRPASAAAVAAYIAAHALAGGDKNVRTYEARFEDERRWQVEWLRSRLRL
jgi:hypothetical protein